MIVGIPAGPSDYNHTFTAEKFKNGTDTPASEFMLPRPYHRCMSLRDEVTTKPGLFPAGIVG